MTAPIGALTASGVNDALGVAVAITGLGFGTARSTAVLRRANKAEIEQMGAIGFVFGLITATLSVTLLAIF